MKEIVFSVLFLLIEVGAFLWFLSAHALSPGFTIVLIVLILKNILVLYTAVQKRKTK